VKTHQFRINFAVAFDEVTSDAEMSEATALPRLALVDDQVTSVERLLDGLTAFQLLEKASALYLSYTVMATVSLEPGSPVSVMLIWIVPPPMTEMGLFGLVTS